MNSKILVAVVLTSVPPTTAAAMRRYDSPPTLDAEARSSLSAAYQAARHAIVTVEGGHRTRNDGQEMSASFDGRGLTVTPDASSWSFGLELARYGFEGSERRVEQPLRVTADGSRITYHWDGGIEEWYVNEARGIEHGFTVHERPGDAHGSLTFTLALRGSVLPMTGSDARIAHFVDEHGATVLTYSGLVAFDADGRALAAGLAASGCELRITLDERGARYPLTIDPVIQQAYIKASNTGTNDRFGEAVAIDDDTAVVGAPGEDSAATGVNGDQSNNAADSAGAAYVFVRSGSTWSQQAYLKISTLDSGGLDTFGSAVAIHDDTIVVGAPGDDSDATGINGDESDFDAEESGAAYVFVRSGTTWSQQAYLKASNTEEFDYFGSAVAVFGDTIVVGAPEESSGATGINGNQADGSAPNAGAAYVFVRSGTTWSQQAYLKASNTEAQDFFARSVSVSSTRIVVGAPGEDSNATGTNGNQADNSATSAGAAYLFQRSGSTWTQIAYLKASNTQAGDIFGTSVAIDSDTVAVGAYGEDSNATGVNGDQNDNSLSASGAAYVFVRDAVLVWPQQAYFKASNPGVDDSFGSEVALTTHTLVVAAPNEDSNATGMNGNGANNSAADSGAVYVFTRFHTTWAHQSYVKASNSAAGDSFGSSVSVDGNTAIVGADSEDSNAIGIGGNEANNSASASGAAYVFTTVPDPFAYCFGDGLDPLVTAQCPCGNFGDPGRGCANTFSISGGLLTTTGTTTPNTLLLTASSIPNNTLTVGLRSTANSPQGFVYGDGVRCQSGTLIRFGAHNSGTNGDAPNTWSSATVSVALGITRYYQIQYRNSSPAFCPPETFNVTNGLILVW